MSNARKHVDFEINLLPVISILAVCICFLLLTAVWVNVGTIDTAQAIGAENLNSSKNPPSLIVQLDKNQSFELQLKDIQASQRRFMIQPKNGKADWSRLETALKALRQKYPEMETSVVLTRPQVKYGHTIQTVDQLKQANFKDVGISPM